jgi:hypothetical protein
MEKNERAIEVLNDLIRINNDRIEGYEKAVNKTNETDLDLTAVFNQMAQESRKYANELTAQVRRLGGDPASGTTASSERKSVLEECEYGEDAAQKAYEKALAPDNELPADVRSLIQEEKRNLKNSHDTIRNYRDRQRAANK